MKISIINGPNLNMLGAREPEIYGDLTLERINNEIIEYAGKYGYVVEFFQSNIEGEIINKIHSLNNSADFIIINPGAYTHTSVAIYDALKSVSVKSIEVHLSNLHSRAEEFRKKCLTTGACLGQISGFGYKSYLLAIDAVYLSTTK
ncbi:MAG TPA: type II 3-dehydroquinate dehydratase [bacterium]|nr:type II 3-dehydroquinate dehydratase [bacterium]